MKTLKEQIAEFDRKKSKRVPHDVLGTMNDSILGLKNMGLEDRCLTAGDTAPEFTLVNHTGNERSLAGYLKTSPVVLTFYRGGW